ncbi:MAG: Iron-sulfur cluster repair protein YtfE [Elusimicrobia bacterium]|nr:Iron-sulfur cluster repair protein YtfE [Elusimicrobiota bacterium]
MTDKSITEFFENDHREIDAIFEGLSYGDAAKDLALFKEFDRRLERHIRWEEDLLFPAIGAINPMIAQGPVRVMKLEHEAIRHSKAKAKEAFEKGDLAGSREHSEAVKEVLTQHNIKEEQILYPTCDQSLDERAVKELFDKINAERSL